MQSGGPETREAEKGTAKWRRADKSSILSLDTVKPGNIAMPRSWILWSGYDHISQPQQRMQCHDETVTTIERQVQSDCKKANTESRIKSISWLQWTVWTEKRGDARPLRSLIAYYSWRHHRYEAIYIPESYRHPHVHNFCYSPRYCIYGRKPESIQLSSGKIIRRFTGIKQLVRDWCNQGARNFPTSVHLRYHHFCATVQMID